MKLANTKKEVHGNQQLQIPVETQLLVHRMKTMCHMHDVISCQTWCRSTRVLHGLKIALSVLLVT